MGISLCMIVKDEEKHLQKALDSVKDHVDEIVLVDTGSTDGTLKIIEEYADMSDQIKWEGFSHARNHSLDLATKEVIFILDADEEVESPELLRVMEKQILEEGVDAVAVLLHNLLPNNQMLSGDYTKQIRMFPNKEELRYEGSVHNQIADCLKRNPRDGKESKFSEVPLKIIHHGYNLSPEELKEKYRNRVGAMKEEVSLHQESGEEAREHYYRYQTANAYFMMKEHDNCLAWIRTVNFELLTDQNKYSAAILACHSCGLLKLYDEGLEYANKMLAIKPDEGMSFLFMGMSYMLLQRWSAAYTFLGATLALQDHVGSSFSYALDRAYICGPAGECALKLNRLGEAKSLFAEYLKVYPEDKNILAMHDAIIPADDLKAGEGKGEIPDSRKTD